MTLAEKLLAESPQLISDLHLELDRLDTNYVRAKKLQKKARWLPTVFSDGGVDVVRDRDTLFALNMAENRIQVSYYAHLTVVKTPMGDGVYQDLVWKSSLFDTDNKWLPGNVMIGYLLPTYKLLVCDRQQTTGGRRLWLSIIPRALRDGCSVFAWNHATGVAAPIKKISDVNIDTLWGKEESFQVLVRINHGKESLARKSR